MAKILQTGTNCERSRQNKHGLPGSVVDRAEAREIIDRNPVQLLTYFCCTCVRQPTSWVVFYSFHPSRCISVSVTDALLNSTRVSKHGDFITPKPQRQKKTKRELHVSRRVDATCGISHTSTLVVGSRGYARQNSRGCGCGRAASAVASI